MKPPHPYRTLGRWLFWHYRGMARDKGIPYTLVRMRKASIPEPMRDLILAPDPWPERPPRPGWRGWLDRASDFLFPNR